MKRTRLMPEDEKKRELETLVTHEGNEVVIELIRLLKRGAQTIAFTGAEGGSE